MRTGDGLNAVVQPSAHRLSLRVGLLIACLVAITAFATNAGRANAHAYLARSDPSAGQVLASAPKTLRLWFTEAPEPRFTTVFVLSSDGAVVQTIAMAVNSADPNRAVAPIAHLPDGAYVIAWRTVSTVDAHESAGSFPIGVGTDPEVAAFLAVATRETVASQATAPRTAVRAFTYLASSLTLGGPVFGLIVLGPVLARRKLGTGLLVAPTWQVGAVGAVLCAIVLVWSVVAQATEGAGSDGVAVLGEGIGAGSPIAIVLRDTRFGHVATGRAVGLLLLCIAMASTRDLHQARPDQRAGRRRWAVTVLLAALLAVTISLNSHAAAQPLETGAVIANWLHIVAAGTWVGGLITLSLTVTRARSVIADPGACRVFVSSLVERFSPLAAVCVAILALSGAWQTWLLAGSSDAILGTPHGWALLLKLALVGALLAVAGINLIYTRPALAREAAAALEAGLPTPGAIAVLEAVSGVVEVLMVGVLLVTGVLTQLPPAREAYAEVTGGTFREATVDGLRLRLRLNPGRPG
jgi:copper transport protein